MCEADETQGGVPAPPPARGLRCGARCRHVLRTLLGAIIERVTHQTRYKWASRQVSAPAGMTATASLIEGYADPVCSVGYTRVDPDKPWASANTLPYRGISIGDGDSTVTDLLHSRAGIPEPTSPITLLPTST